MSQFLDASAFVKVLVDEPDSRTCERRMTEDPDWVAARLCYVEVRRNLARLLEASDLPAAREVFESDWARCFVVELDKDVVSLAADIAESTGTRTLDALHLAAAVRFGPLDTFHTYDERQAAVARELGFEVVGAG